MKNHHRAIWPSLLSIAAIMAVPAVADASLSTSQAARALHTSHAGLMRQTGLSSAQLDTFVRGAQTAGGLSERQVLVALRNPSLIRTIGVTETRTSDEAHLSARYPEHGCRRSGSYVTLNSVANIRLWTFKLSKHWCWDKSERRVSVTKGSIETDVDIPQGAAIAGWDYQGLDDGGKSDYYYQYQDSGSHGAHQSYRRGVMKFCPIRVGCANTRRPKLRLGTRWTGSAWENHDVG